MADKDVIAKTDFSARFPDYQEVKAILAVDPEACIYYNKGGAKKKEEETDDEESEEEEDRTEPPNRRLSLLDAAGIRGPGSHKKSKRV